MILWLNPAAGISGDMLLGALLDLGAPLDDVRAAITSTGVTGWDLDLARVDRAGLVGAHAVVTVHDTATVRAAAELLGSAGRAQPAPVAATAVRAITLLAETEAALHGVPVDQVHLHELGGLDTIVDVVGVCAALHALGVTQVWSAPVGVGAGTVRTAHGVLPAPAPATLALLAGADVRGLDLAAETVTPTGAALLRAIGTRYGPMPASTVVRTGYGAGTRDTPGVPNLLQATLATPAESPDTTSLVVVETTVDDVPGELLGDLVALLLDHGALDAWLAPVLGKKGRPAHVVTALCPPGHAGAVEDALLRETGSLGARRYLVERRALPRRFAEVTVAGHPVRVKIGPHHAKPEHDDVAAVARATGLSRANVAERALRALAGPEAPSGGRPAGVDGQHRAGDE